LALASGAITSGIGYAIWYAALRHLAAAQAAIVQLTVPAIAATGAILILGEAFSYRLLIASAAILGGVLLVLAAKR
jgi:drug/metabolite transporter (DMT)-like permease